MSSAVRALVIVLALVVVGIVGWRLSGGSDSAARDSARCMDPRQKGCYGNVTAGVLTSDKPKGKGDARDSDSEPRTPQHFDVPRTEVMASVNLANLSSAGPRGNETAEALRLAISDLMQGLPDGTTPREVPTGDPDTSLVEYISRTGDLLWSIMKGRGGVTATDHDRGLVFNLNQDGTLREDGALADPNEPAGRRGERLSRHWDLPRAEAMKLGRSDSASAAFIDLRRAGIEQQTALSLAQQATGGLPGFSDWQKAHSDDLAGIPEAKMMSIYKFLSAAPVISRLLSGILGEPPEQVAQRFGYDDSAARRFLDGSTQADRLLAQRLAAQDAIPARIRNDLPNEKKTLRGLIGDPLIAAALPLCLGSLQRALDEPEGIAQLLSLLPAGYPYVLLSEVRDGRKHPLLLDAATILSWAVPVRPDDPAGLAQGVARLGALPADAPVAIQVTLQTAAATLLGLSAAQHGEARLRAFAPAGALRETLAEEQSLSYRLRGLLAEPAERPPASYFGNPPFVYASVLRANEKDDGRGAEVLARRGLPSAALLGLSRAGIRHDLPVPVPADLPEGLRTALSALLAAHERAAASLDRLRDPLGQNPTGRAFLDKWDAVEGQVAMAGLLGLCAVQGRCVLPGLSRAEDGAAHLVLLQKGLAELRPRVLLVHLLPAEAAQAADRLGAMLLAADRAAGTLAPRRSFSPGRRDAAALARITGYIRAASGEAPLPDPAHAGALLVRDLDAVGYRDRLRSWEKGQALPAAAELDGEILRLRRERGEIPGTLGELVQRHGAALQAARPMYLAAGQGHARVDRRVRLRLSAGLSRISLVQTMDQGGGLRDVEVLAQKPSGELDGYSYDGDGRLIMATKTSAAPLGGSGCLDCHRDKKGQPLLTLPAAWQPGAGGVTWLTPVVAAELAKTAAARRAAELFP